MTKELFKRRDKISDRAYRTLLDLFMVLDPWPLKSEDHAYMLGFMNAEASKRGYDDWLEAYHELTIAKADDPEGEDDE